MSKLWFKVAVISACSLVRNLPVTLNFALAANFSISCSRSTIRAKSGRLYASGRNCARNFTSYNSRKVKTDEHIEGLAGLLG